VGTGDLPRHRKGPVSRHARCTTTLTPPTRPHATPLTRPDNPPSGQPTRLKFLALWRQAPRWGIHCRGAPWVGHRRACQWTAGPPLRACGAGNTARCPLRSLIYHKLVACIPNLRVDTKLGPAGHPVSLPRVCHEVAHVLLFRDTRLGCHGWVI